MLQAYAMAFFRNGLSFTSGPHGGVDVAVARDRPGRRSGRPMDPDTHAPAGRACA
jgi:hypothetical protein